MKPQRLQHTDPTKRFSQRVSFYIRSRPSYPPAVLDFFRRELGLRPDPVIADVGSGTGISSELFLRNGNTVIGVEPNREMREAGDELLKPKYPKFRSVDGTAEATTLADASVDYVVAGQAFHWFDPDGARTEFRRILKRGGWAVLMWNDRRPDPARFSGDYERIVRQYNTDVTHVHHSNVTTKDDAAPIRAFFGGRFSRVEFPNEQSHDLSGVKDRVLSSSYMPTESDPRFGDMMRDLEASFALHQRDGMVTLEYATELFYGRLG
jgi:SAM-dependent methyltransferase